MANPTNLGNTNGTAHPQPAQQPPTQAPVRNLPKKRKFDPSELEEIERNCANTIPISAPAPMSIDYQQQSYQNSMVQPSSILVNRHSPSTEKPYMHYPNIDLAEWKDHRVLAKQRGLYLAGVIRQAEHCKVLVEFDGQDNDTVEYSDIFGVNKYDIISDACPQVNHLQIGSFCVVRTADHSRDCVNVFVEGRVCDVLSAPIRIRVQVFIFLDSRMFSLRSAL